MCPFALEALYRASSYYNVLYDFPLLMDGKLTGVRDLPALQCLVSLVTTCTKRCLNIPWMVGRIFNFPWKKKKNFVNKGREGDVNEYVVVGNHEIAHLSFFCIFFSADPHTQLYPIYHQDHRRFWQSSPLFFSNRINYSPFLILCILLLNTHIYLRPYLPHQSVTST